MQCMHLFVFATDDSFSAWALNTSPMHAGLGVFDHIGDPSKTKKSRKHSVHPTSDITSNHGQVVVKSMCGSMHEEPLFARETKVQCWLKLLESFAGFLGIARYIFQDRRYFAQYSAVSNIYSQCQ